MTLSLTPSIKPSVKKSIPTLVLLAIILVLSGCVGKAIDGAINRATSNATNLINKGLDGLDGLDGVNDIAGINDLEDTDPCFDRDALFSNPFCTDTASKNNTIYNDLREVQCIDSYDAILCAPTVRRVCTANARKQLCHDVEPYKGRREQDLAIVSVSDWTNSFTTDDSAAIVIPLNTTPSVGEERNQFLLGLTVATLNGYGLFSDFEATLAGNDTEEQRRAQQLVFTVRDKNTRTGGLSRSIGTLTLAHKQANIGLTEPIFHGFKEAGATEADAASTGDITDGVSFVAGQFYSRFGGCSGNSCVVHRYYAGVHATTDLGAPITDTAQVSEWSGLLRIVGDTNLISLPFDINIAFNRETRGGTIKADFANIGVRYIIDATFDNFGAITGDITAFESPGKVSGIIGEEGLVAAFISNATGATNDTKGPGYAGGFAAYLPNPPPPELCIVRKSCVDYVHWADAGAANPTTTPTANRFLTGTAGGLTTGESDTGMVFDFSANATAHGLSGTPAPGGFAIFSAGTTHNVGILSTTRFTSQWTNTNAQWLGSFRVREGVAAIKASNITLTVNYDSSNSAGRTITGTNQDGTGQYYVDATYDNFGVMSGTITRTVNQATTTGTISGLIGVSGVWGATVGVFHSDANQGAAESYVGGFVASSAPKIASGS